MAVTSIWPIKGRVDKVINYARNPEKTHDKKSLLNLHEIEGVIEYAADEMKTETRAFVTCLNLSSEENAAKEFMEVKHRYLKEDGRVCYHGYQSFKADEVDADTAHNIGVALARELWGDRFQVVIATHCNTGHYHNHFVINSVSDVDGLKFYNSPQDYRHMREVSDRLCREARISVIENPDGKKKNYGEWFAEKNGKPTVRDTIRADIDRAILASTTERDFISVMEEMGYKIETKTETGAPRQHPIVILHGKKHFRLDKLGEFYELESIKQRIQNNIRKRVPFPEVKEDKKAPYYHYKEKAQKATGLYALYLYYCYNPFVYLQSDDDIQRLTTNLFKNTTPKGSQTQDPFWDQTAAMLLKALVCYLHYEAPPDEQNFPMVMEMIRAGDVKENNEDYLSVLDELFERLEAKNPEHIALKYYRAYHSGSAKTLKSIQISLVSRLEKFNLDSLAGITQTDEMDLGEIGERKTAVFAVIPDNDSSFNFIVGMLYTQLFQQLYYQADSVHGGRLPVHVHFVMDEFANVALPDEFDKLLSTMRSREISVSIIIQNLAQLKALFEKQWESIVGNCDEFLYLGGNEQSTHEYVSKLLGKETIDTNTYGRSRGRNGSYSTNYQLTGRELMTPDEVRMLDNQYALLFIRGERPVQDFKYDILHHPNVRETTDGGAPAFTHGEDTRSIAAMSFVFDKNVVKQAQEIKPELHDFELLSEEELQEIFDKKEKEEHEKHQS